MKYKELYNNLIYISSFEISNITEINPFEKIFVLDYNECKDYISLFHNIKKSNINIINLIMNYTLIAF